MYPELKMRIGVITGLSVALCLSSCNRLNPAFDELDDGSGSGTNGGGNGTDHGSDGTNDGDGGTDGGSGGTHSADGGTTGSSSSGGSGTTDGGSGTTSGSATSGGFDWGLSDCAKRVRLSFDNSGVDETLSAFPVLVVLDQMIIDYGDAASDGSDIHFVDEDDATALPHQIEQWVEDGTSWLWVGVPEIDALSTDDFVWMYFDCTGSSSQDPGALWDPVYDGVWHLHDDLQDSTSANNDGTSVSSSNGAGIVADGQDFDGNGARVEVDANANLQAAATVSAWAEYDSLGSSTGDNMLVACGGPSDASADNYLYTLNVEDDRRIHMYWEYNSGQDYDGMYSSTAAPVSPGDWHHYVFVRDSGNQDVRFYVDGEPLGSVVDYSQHPSGGTAAEIWLGAAPSGPGTWNLNGRLDEIRISRQQLSRHWIQAEHRSTTNAYITYGPVESQ